MRGDRRGKVEKVEKGVEKEVQAEEEGYGAEEVRKG